MVDEDNVDLLTCCCRVMNNATYKYRASILLIVYLCAYIPAVLVQDMGIKGLFAIIALITQLSLFYVLVSRSDRTEWARYRASTQPVPVIETV